MERKVVNKKKVVKKLTSCKPRAPKRKHRARKAQQYASITALPILPTLCLPIEVITIVDREVAEEPWGLVVGVLIKETKEVTCPGQE